MQNLEHHSITRTLLTGYLDEPYDDTPDYDEDAVYEEKREREMGWTN